MWFLYLSGNSLGFAVLGLANGFRTKCSSLRESVEVEILPCYPLSSKWILGVVDARTMQHISSEVMLVCGDQWVKGRLGRIIWVAFFV